MCRIKFNVTEIDEEKETDTHTHIDAQKEENIWKEPIFIYTMNTMWTRKISEETKGAYEWAW